MAAKIISGIMCVFGFALMCDSQTELQMTPDVTHEPGANAGGVPASLDLVPAPCAILDGDGRVMAVNAAWNATPGLLTLRCGQDFLETLAASTHSARFAAGLREVLDGKTTAFTIDIGSGGGSGARWFRMTAAPCRPSGASVLLVDISDRQSAQESMRESESRFRQMVELVQDHAMYTLDASGNVLTWNIGAERIYGYSAAEIVGRSASVFFGPEEIAARTPEHMFAVAAEAGRYELEGWRVRKDGSTFWAFAVLSALRDQAGGLRGFSTVTRDLTERRRSEGTLRETEVRLSNIIDSAMDAIITVDESQRVIMFNHSAERIFGVQAADALGGTLDRFIPGRFRAAHRSHVRSFGRTGVTTRAMGRLGTLYGVRAGGKEFPIEASISHTTSEGQKLYTVILRDITERRSLEEQLLQSQKMEGIGRLAGGVAHDFNNLLTVIFGYLAAASAALDPHHPAQNALLRTREAADKAGGLTRQLLAFARKQSLTPRKLRLGDVVGGLVPMLRRLIGEDLVLKSVIAPDTGCVMADAGQLEQVLVNLAVNARDAMPRGGTLVIEAGNVELDESYCNTRIGATVGPHVMLAVSDTGGGMTQEVMERLFEPFFTTKGPGKGTGLGLATCHGIVKQFGGHIAVYSEPDRGTSVKVFLPRTDEAATSEAAGGVAVAPRGGGETILLVEDNEMVRMLVEDGLRSKGYIVLVASNGPRALEVVATTSRTIDLVITDVVMPEMSGVQLMEELGRRGMSSAVIYMSGYTEETIMHHGIETDTTAFLGKPFMVTDLLFKVRSILDTQHAATKPGSIATR